MDGRDVRSQCAALRARALRRYGAFFVMAVAVMLAGLRVYTLGEHTWAVLGGVIVAGGIGLWVLPEMI